MLTLGKKLGFEIGKDSDSGENELVIHFGGNELGYEFKGSA
jgi:hypothetical protein